MRIRSTWQHGPFVEYDIEGQNVEKVIPLPTAVHRAFDQPEGEAYLDIAIPYTGNYRPFGEAVLYF